MSAVSVAAKDSQTVTLRTLLDQRRAQGRTFSLEEAIATVVPLCLDLKERHQRGERFYVHAAAVAPGADGLARLAPALALMPSSAQDLAAIAPELLRSAEAGGARASVFGVGALLYEMVTGAHIGPAMRRPHEVNPAVPEALETLLAKALVGDPAHRPDDLGALASAMHMVAPKQSMRPPPADVSALDSSAEFEVDIRLSMLPPSERWLPGASGPAADENADNGASAPLFGNPPPPRTNDPTARLADLKVRLESDPRPRYVVSKDHMDHGPFSAVELLQQIASNHFHGDLQLRDEISGQSKLISEWDEFAPFAEQTALRREIVAEKKAVERVTNLEAKAGVAKSGLTIAIVVGILVVLGAFVAKAVGSRRDSVAIADDKSATNVDPAGSIRGQKIAKLPGAGGGGGGGGWSGGGLSFEAAWAKAEQKVDLSGGQGRDLSQDQLSGPLRNASFINGCGAPDSMKVTVKAAIQNGHVVGVTAYTVPANGSVSACVERAVRGVVWPFSPNMDAVTTTY